MKRPRNNGFGKSLEEATKRSLFQRYGDGHFASVFSHLVRFNQALSYFSRTHGAITLQDIDQAMLDGYAQDVSRRVEDGLIRVSYGQNLLSSTNVVLEALRGDQKIRVSPRSWAGTRCHVRTAVPGGIDLPSLETCINKLLVNGMWRSALVALFARYLGVRLREALLADIPRWLREAKQKQQVNVLDGTKGGRTAHRWVPVSADGLSAIQLAASRLSDSSRNLLLPGETFISLVRCELKAARRTLKKHGIKGYHDLRAAYACARYRVLTGHFAPVISPGAVVDRTSDLHARTALAHELGHGRVDVIVSYIGTRSR